MLLSGPTLLPGLGALANIAAKFRRQDAGGFFCLKGSEVQGHPCALGAPLFDIAVESKNCAGRESQISPLSESTYFIRERL